MSFFYALFNLRNLLYIIAERAEVNNMFYPKPEINLTVRAL